MRLFLQSQKHTERPPRRLFSAGIYRQAISPFPVQATSSTLSKAHMLASHWYFLFMSLHIGLHAGMISRKIAAKSKRTAVGTQADGGQKVGDRRFVRFKSVALYVLLVAGCAYGLYTFISRGVWRYLILRQEFFFLDMEKGYALFFTDYIAIIVLFAAAAHYGAAVYNKIRPH